MNEKGAKDVIIKVFILCNHGNNIVGVGNVEWNDEWNGGSNIDLGYYYDEI